jgi:hypothetical protein
MSATRGSRTSAAPTVSPGPGTKCSTSRGTPAADELWRQQRAADDAPTAAELGHEGAQGVRALARPPPSLPLTVASGLTHASVVQAATPVACRLVSVRLQRGHRRLGVKRAGVVAE